jgi:hypothetical protein
MTKTIFISLTLFLFYSCSTKMEISEVQPKIEQCLSDKYKTNFKVVWIGGLSNVANPSMKNSYEFRAQPKGAPEDEFGGRVAINDGKYTLNFDYYLTKIMGRQANAYLDKIIRKYYPICAHRTELTNVQGDIDDLSAFVESNHQDFLIDFPEKIRHYDYVVVPKDSTISKDEHYQKLKSILLEVKNKKIKNYSLTLSFCASEQEQKLIDKPDAFFKYDGTALDKIVDANSIEKWTIRYDNGTVNNLESNLGDIENMIIRF